MQIFLRVVESGSFSEAARLSMTTPSTVSKLIARIEGRLGVRLVERSTRRLTITPEGQLYYERAQVLLSELDDIERSVSQGSAQPKGIVRVNATVAIGALGLETHLRAFWEEHTEIGVDLTLSDEKGERNVERTGGASRVGELHESTMRARRMGVKNMEMGDAV